MDKRCRCVSCIIPPHLLKRLMECKEADIRDAALKTLLATERLRGERHVRALAALAGAPGNGRRTVYDAQHGVDLARAVVARTEDGPPSRDPAVNRAFDGLGATRDFYRQIFGRDSIDGRGARLDAYVHRGVRFNNAFWDGQEMVFGDGDSVVFDDFTKSLDVIAHELTHGVTEYVAGLEYHNQSGALNESMSDVFGSLVKQWRSNQPASQADWLIGAEIFTPSIEADALRSMKSPGSAYDNDLLGRDPQPDHMSKYVESPDTEDGDFGGVHINSGIPNKAFYLTATAIGGFAWKAAGAIWWAALLASNDRTDFQAFAEATYAQAGELFGASGDEQNAVQSAWGGVGIQIGPSVGRRLERAGRRIAGERATVQSLAETIDDLSAEVAVLADDVVALRARRRGDGATQTARRGS